MAGEWWCACGTGPMFDTTCTGCKKELTLGPSDELCKRTNDPKLRWLQAKLASRGVQTWRDGYSSRAPLLRVLMRDRNAAHQLLYSETLFGCVVDDIPDDDPVFDQDATCSHTKEESYWVNDAHGIPLCRVCDSCREQKLAGYRPEILTGYDQSDVNEPIG